MKKYVDSIGLSKAFELIKNAIANKQDTLVSGTNIKTINNTSLLGSGNISISGGGGGLSIDDVYPIGSIYMSTSSTDPGTLFGGSWDPIPGRFLVGAGDNNATGYEALNLTAGDTGGEKDHLLTGDESGNPELTHSPTFTAPTVKTPKLVHSISKQPVHQVPKHSHGLANSFVVYRGSGLGNGLGSGTGAYGTNVSTGSFTHLNSDEKAAFNTSRTQDVVISDHAAGQSCSVSGGSVTVAKHDEADAAQPHNNMPPYLAVYMWKRTA